MTTFRERWGIDGFDVVLHVVITAMVMVGVEELTNEDGLMFLAGAASMVLLGVRRKLALRSAPRTGLSTGEVAALRLEDVEQRLNDLEAAQARVLELEERLDFTERMLARSTGERALVDGKGAP
ncbi:MAG: hypothetical protein JNJ80_25775 [Gemmatimonadetes bacterium]|nr:hypothetical protein [Gemmatimonadota bacterium]